MNFDLLQSRRNYNEMCRWWSRLETDEIDSDELIMRRVATGQFWAKEANPEVNQNTIIGGTFMFDKTTITIKTPDNVEYIKNNDIVVYRGDKWIVVDTQKRHIREQQSEFAYDSNMSHIWYISLRK